MVFIKNHPYLFHQNVAQFTDIAIYFKSCVKHGYFSSWVTFATNVKLSYQLFFKSVFMVFNHWL